MRPLATITHETIQYGIDKDGASVHDVIGSRCVSAQQVGFSGCSCGMPAPDN